MGSVFTTLDIVIFFAALIAAMAIGLVAGRQEKTAEDYFLAGRNIPWWGVAGSIFGSNVSANHMVGMMGIGFSVGFAQTHFELGAIAGLMMLCYGFLPVYRKLRLYTLSEYLGRRYDDRSRMAYAVIMVIIMAVVQMVPALYIGARSICVLLGDDAMVRVEVAGASTFEVNFTYYIAFVVSLAAISASYTVFGGLKAVIWTDVIQSVLLLAAGILVAILTFARIGGWGEMMALDGAGDDKMHLYLPSDHADLPWTGVLSGLMVMHLFYWGTNQFIVERALGARSDREARLGIVAAGFLKMLIPFFAIATGVAAFYLFRSELPDQVIDPDTAFTELVKLVIPVGYGIIGLISAGVIGAILSSIDSMMNSAATIVTMDVYKQFIRPDATDRQLILVGRLVIVALVILAALMAIFVLDPNSKQNFFLQIVDYQNYLTPGLLVAFLLGMFWRRSTPAAGIVTILSGIFFSWLVEWSYNAYHASNVGLSAYFGTTLNFFHRVVVVIVLCVVVHVATSLVTRRDPDKERLVWTDLGGHEPGTLRKVVLAILGSIGVFAILAVAMVQAFLSPTVAAILGAIWTFCMFLVPLVRGGKARPASEKGSILKDDHFWSGLLCAFAVFMMYFFY